MIADTEQHHVKVNKNRRYMHMFQLERGSALDRKAFSGPLETVIAKAREYNRVDVLKDIAAFVDKEQLPVTSNITLSEQNALNKIMEAKTTRDASRDHERSPTLLEHHPKPPNDAIRLHGQSLETFVNAKSGQAFTGLIHLRENGEYKMFLAPVSPSQGSRDNPEKIYAVQEHQTDTPYSLYKKRKIHFSPIEHGRVIDGKPRQSHEQLAKLLAEKYPSDTPKEGKFIGFAVMKGRVIDGVTNQYAFVSRTVNPFTFKDEKGKEGDKVVPPEWQAAIKRTLDRTSVLEYCLHKAENSGLQTPSNGQEEKIPPSYVDHMKNLIKKHG
jgi:hypothetical protein